MDGNVKNKDDNCLCWALRSALFPADDYMDRTIKYPTDDDLNFTEIEAQRHYHNWQKKKNKITWRLMSMVMKMR